MVLESHTATRYRRNRVNILNNYYISKNQSTRLTINLTDHPSPSKNEIERQIKWLHKHKLPRNDKVPEEI